LLCMAAIASGPYTMEPREKSEDFGADTHATPISNPKDRLPFLDGGREERVPAPLQAFTS
jgi:hypothetical protein